ncbi:hypothetical protein BDF20DRAFT_877948 [Mycotypha africana]|uniref:uncharacterized protein n=1 Tax=Mycotypha africana TaxID=64632 RepID=UPI0022FFFBC1|nr:uncharacterized protein BDF20DRAFT_877948 [Mycotypha africana]KAI8975315.1 hypothetical protein BDF20DRAFT_877948 [Mycotypha africana]
MTDNNTAVATAAATHEEQRQQDGPQPEFTSQLLAHSQSSHIPLPPPQIPAHEEQINLNDIAPQPSKSSLHRSKTVRNLGSAGSKMRGLFKSSKKDKKASIIALPTQSTGDLTASNGNNSNHRPGLTSSASYGSNSLSTSTPPVTDSATPESLQQQQHQTTVDNNRTDEMTNDIHIDDFNYNNSNNRISDDAPPAIHSSDNTAAQLQAELEHLNELIAQKSQEVQAEKSVKERLEADLLEAQRVFKEREVEYANIEHSFFEHTRSVRATDDDLSTIRDSFKLLKYSIARLIMTLNKKADKVKATEKFCSTWPDLPILSTASSVNTATLPTTTTDNNTENTTTTNDKDQHPNNNETNISTTTTTTTTTTNTATATTTAIVETEKWVDPSLTNLLAEKLVHEHLVKYIFSAPIYPGLKVNDAYFALHSWLQQHNSQFSVRLRQQMAAVVAKSTRANNNHNASSTTTATVTATPATATNSTATTADSNNTNNSNNMSEIQQVANKEKQKIAQKIYDDLADIYHPFIRENDAQVDDENKRYYSKICDIVDKAMKLTLAIRGQEVEIKIIPIEEGSKQPFEEDTMTEVKGRTQGLVRFCICPTFMGGDREHGFLEKGKVVVSGQ